MLFGLVMVAVMIAGCFLMMRMMGGGMCGHRRHGPRDGKDVRRPG